MTSNSARVGERLRRMAPRLAAAVVAAVIVGLGTHWSVRSLLLGAVLIAAAALPLPRPWWRHLPRRTVTVADRFTEPGPFQVELVDAGERGLETLKAVREVVVHDFRSARALVDGAPGVLVDGLSRTSADAVAGRLEAAGAQVRVTSPAASLDG